MKVVRTSNFDDEMYTEVVVAEGLTEPEARDKAAQLNSTTRRPSLLTPLKGKKTCQSSLKTILSNLTLMRRQN